MVGMLGNVAAQRKLMMAELMRAGLLKPAQQLTKSMTYDATRQLVTPDKQGKTDTRERVMEKWLQAALNVVLGLRLKIDGTWSGDTRAALQRFQREEGLHSHGFLDDKTLQALEDRLGMRAPREGRLQGSPRLWQLDRREQEMWARRPGQPPDKPAPPRQNQPDGAKTADPERLAAQVAVVLQREAVAAVIQQAFARDWVVEQLEQRGRTGDAALHAEMTSWFTAAQTAADSPAWLAQVTDLARTRPDDAVARLRRAWSDAHSEGNP